MLQAPHQMVLPALDQSAGSFSDALEHAILSKCHAWRASSHHDFDSAQPTLVKIHAQGASENEIVRTLQQVDELFPSHAIVMSASAPSRLHKRFIPVQPQQMQSRGKFLERYQLFSSSTVLSLGVVVFLLFFVLIAVNLLSTTETPDKLGSGKSVSQDKKRQ